jgi:hypothetical protein
MKNINDRGNNEKNEKMKKINDGKKNEKNKK